MENNMKTDVLVIGSGGAGARAAIEAALNGADVVIATKGNLAKSGITPLAEWSFEAPLGHADPQDSAEIHFEDTVREGRFLSDQNLVEALVNDAVERVHDLEKFGVRFKKDNGKFVQTKIPGQSHPRSVMIINGGLGMMMGLKKEMKKHEQIRPLEDTIITKILTEKKRVSGATFLNLRTGEFGHIQCNAIVIATGGHQELWPVTDTPPESVGDGFVLAYYAGAEMVDMEMLLFYPVVAVYPEHIRGTIIPYECCIEPSYASGKLINGTGEEFLPEGSPPVRDILIRKMFDEINEGRGTEHDGIYLDLAKSPKSKKEITGYLEDMIPSTFKHLLDLDVDIREEPIEIAPAAHYALGGIKINEKGETNITGLYAAGECAGNVQGANRLSGNALTETQVFGTRAGKNAAIYSQKKGHLTAEDDKVANEKKRIMAYLEEKENGSRPLHLKEKIKKIMWKYVGPKREEGGLKRAVKELSRLRENDLAKIYAPNINTYNYEWMEAIEADSMVTVAEIVSAAALLREESRGHHYREDFPEQDDEKWLQHTMVKLDNGKMVVDTAPVIMNKLTPG